MGPTEYKIATRRFARHGGLPSVRWLPKLPTSGTGSTESNDIDRAIGRSLNQASQDGCRGAQARQEAGARHARLAREGRANLRVAALPPRKKVRGALDPPCARRPRGCVGARGAQTHRRALAARRRTRGMDWFFRFWRVRLGDPGEAAQIPSLTNPIQGYGRSRAAWCSD